jgi:hypothetical protein
VQPEAAYVMKLEGEASGSRDEVLRDDAGHLDADGVRELQMLGASGAFDRVFP